MKETNWTKWASIAEILSAVAILITLLYLGLQTRYLAEQTRLNSQTIMAQGVQSLIDRDLANTNLMVEYPEILEFLFTGRELEEREAARLYAFLVGFTRTRESYFLSYTLGVITEDNYQRFEFPFLYLLQFERINNFWQNQKQAFDPRFVARTDSRLGGVALSPGNEEHVQGFFRAPQ
jgi:hypothetical protein